MRRDQKIVDSMLDLIGDIPLVRLNRIGRETGVEILVKPEFLNPSGSIKDRIAKLMIENAEQEGMLGKDKKIIEATTGNTGTALAFVAAVKGYEFVAYAPTKVANRSRMAIMQAYGAELETVDTDSFGQKQTGDKNKPAASSAEASVHGGRIELAGRQICLDLERSGAKVWWARQFSNPLNTAAHREWTAREILEQTDGELDAFVTSVGTGGTILGIAQALKANNPQVLIIGVEPAGSPMMGSRENYPIIPGISDGIIPEIWESGLVDRVLSVSNEEAVQQAHELAEKEGIFCGMSSGANVLASLQIASELGPGKRVVTILPDSRDRYLEVEKYTT